MNKLEIIQAGESLNFDYDRDGESIDGWTCTVTIKQKPSDADNAFMTPRVINPVGNSWPGFFTQTETNGLAIGLYYRVALLQSVTTDEQEIKNPRFRISTAWV